MTPVPLSTSADESGRALSSWRFAILPYSPAGPTGPEDKRTIKPEEYDAKLKWDHPKNRALTSMPMDLFCFGKGNETNVFAVTGPGTSFDPNVAGRIGDFPNDTIVLIEVAKSEVPWAAPGDLDIEKIPDSITRGFDGNGVHVTFADGEVWYLRKEVPVEKLSRFFRIGGARQFDREVELRPYLLDD